MFTAVLHSTWFIKQLRYCLTNLNIDGAVKGVVGVPLLGEGHTVFGALVLGLNVSRNLSIRIR